MCSSAFATPRLGVATDTGIYAYTGDTSPDDEWIKFFASDIVPCIAGQEGFVVGPSGSSLTVFTNYNPPTTLLYLIANTGGDLMPMSFGGMDLILNDINNPFITGQADGYTAKPYAYVQLINTAWKPAPPEFPKEGDKDFWFYTAPVIYIGAWKPADGYYFFAGADTNGTPNLQYNGSDAFSPKTASSGGHTPEPATMLLFGIGAFGFGVFKRRKR